MLQRRIPCGEEEFLSWHFPSGQRRDAARFLWRVLESHFSVDLRGLHPDDDLSAIVGDGGWDSLDTAELIMALEDFGRRPVVNDVPAEDCTKDLRTFKQLVDGMTRNASRSG
jgi:acyl carrier protein